MSSISARRLLLVQVLITCCITLHAQDREIVNESILWVQYSVKKNISEKYSGSFATQYRAFLDRESGYHLFFTLGVSRKLDYGFSLGAGFTNLNINREVDGGIVLVPEIRPYQQVAFTQSLGRSKFSWKFMVEQRFFKNARDGELVRGFNNNWRFRNKAGYNQYLSDKWDLILSSEIMFNAGNIGVNIFDQHRAQLLLGYKGNSFGINMGYMHWFFQTASNRHENRHTLVMAFTHSI